MKDPALDRLNQMPKADALQALGRCCGSRTWVEQMEAKRPFENRIALMRLSDDTFGTLARDDWLEAFAQHPRIGDLSGIDRSEEAEWSAGEQSSALDAPAELLNELAELNDEYERQFGYTYIVCATGLEIADMIADVKRRLEYPPHVELSIAGDHQRRITEIRLEKLLDSLASEATTRTQE